MRAVAANVLIFFSHMVVGMEDIDYRRRPEIASIGSALY